MEKTNFLKELLAKRLTIDENVVEITLAVSDDDNLYKFFAKQSVLTIFANTGKKNPSANEIGEQMAKAIYTASKLLPLAVVAYQEYLDLGDQAILKRMASAIIVRQFVQMAEEYQKQAIFKEHFGNIFDKAE